MMGNTKPSTLGALKASGWVSRSVREEMRLNLMALLKTGSPLMPGVHGFDDSVLRQLARAVLAKHSILLLGLRGQGKTRILRRLTEWLDPEIPALAGTELHEDPYAPITADGRRRLLEGGEDTPITWISREARYGEKLATPDVSMADLIGDIDPVKALNQRLSFGDEASIQFGLLPRSHRGLFVVNELPDLQPRIQVGLLNILEEGDVQIRGFKVRLPLDVFLAFSANPEDYTNRGNIITPLKDRIDSQILTHYPRSVEMARKITEQEAWIDRSGSIKPQINELLADLLERVAFVARADKDFVDQKSGVSARLSISARELLQSAVESRGIRTGENNPKARLLDLESVLPALTGKLELVYAGEQEGPSTVARVLVGRAIREQFDMFFVDPYRKGDRDPTANPYHKVLKWFEGGKILTLGDDANDKEHALSLESVAGLSEAIGRCLRKGVSVAGIDSVLLMELLIEGLHQHQRLTRQIDGGVSAYRDAMIELMPTGEDPE